MIFPVSWRPLGIPTAAALLQRLGATRYSTGEDRLTYQFLRVSQPLHERGHGLVVYLRILPRVAPACSARADRWALEWLGGTGRQVHWE
jgi:hypothetical protein